MSLDEEKDNRNESKKCKLEILKQFCDNTSIHGLKYVVENGNLLYERIFWLLFFLSGVGFSSYFCWQMWEKWEQSPVLTSVESHLYPLENEPFPAVTICNVNKVSDRKLKDALSSSRFENVSYKMLQQTLRYMTKLDRAINMEKELEDLSSKYKSLNISALDLFELLENTAPSCSDMIMDCNWLGLPKPCIEYFSFLPTDDGMCCIFNKAKYYDSLLGIESSVQEMLRVNGNGYRMGLSLVIDARINDYSVTNGKFDGFKVLVHSPEEFSDVSDRGFILGPGMEAFVGVKVITSFSTEEVTKQVPLTKRNCIAKSEKELFFYQNYSRSACFVECATQVMIEKCQCRPYFLKAHNDTQICDLKFYPCISDVYEEVRLNGKLICDCLPSCTNTWYEPEISYGPFPGRGFNLTRTFKRLVEARNLSTGSDENEYFKSNVAVLHVYYKEKTGLRYRTDIRYGIEDFISAMGGLLGLGLGMSFLSVIELLYYLLFRQLFIRIRENHQSICKTSISSRNAMEVDIIKTVDAAPSTQTLEEWPSMTTMETSVSNVYKPSSLNVYLPRARSGSFNHPNSSKDSEIYKF